VTEQPTEPTAAAMKAVDELFGPWDTDHRERRARIIDAATGLPELIEAAHRAVEALELARGELCESPDTAVVHDACVHAQEQLIAACAIEVSDAPE